MNFCKEEKATKSDWLAVSSVKNRRRRAIPAFFGPYNLQIDL